MRALITGGAGFVGSHLAEALLRAGAEVAVIDDLSTGSIENLEHLPRVAWIGAVIEGEGHYLLRGFNIVVEVAK